MSVPVPQAVEGRQHERDNQKERCHHEDAMNQPGSRKFFIAGLPAPKGSTRAFMNRRTNRPIITHVNPLGQKAWSTAVKDSAMKAGLKPEGDCAIFMSVTFHMRRPKLHYDSKGVVKENRIDEYCITRPDIDKLSRALLDALTGIAYQDDSQVWALDAEKVFISDETDFKPGAMVDICQMKRISTRK
jgi:crossover junction endodeoxyribonuclease RusA